MRQVDDSERRHLSSGRAHGQPPLDESVILRVRSDFHDEDGSLVDELITSFVEISDTFMCASTLPLDVLQVSLAQCAQRLRTAAAMVGARHVAMLCHELELSDRDGVSQRQHELVAAITGAIEVAKRALTRLAGSLRAAPAP
jgi:HPt (histidine-containing phosphotransfer) domain-containing protein